MLSFDDMIKRDHLTMLNKDKFGTSCTNSTNGQVFNIIKTDAFVEITSDGLAIIEDKPMFNTSLNYIDEDGNIANTVINQHDVLVIDSISYIVRDVKKDGIGGMDIYLKA